MIENNFARILCDFEEAGVEFIVVGGISAVLNGVPVNTLDLDLVHSREPGNITRLLPVLENLEAIFRIQQQRRIKPAASHLASPAHLNLVTRYGPLDLPGTVGKGLSYEDLLPHALQKQIAESVFVKVLDLPTLIALKEELGDEKDRAMLPILRRTLEESRRISK